MDVGIGLRFMIFAVFAVVIAVVDLRCFRIPDLILVILAVILLAVDIYGERGVIPFRLAAGISAFGLFYGVYRFRGGLGFGDVKYAGVIGYFLGPGRVIIGLLCAILLGTAVWIAGRVVLRWSRTTRFPFGPWLSAGALLAALLPAWAWMEIAP